MPLGEWSSHIHNITSKHLGSLSGGCDHIHEWSCIQIKSHLKTRMRSPTCCKPLHQRYQRALMALSLFKCFQTFGIAAPQGTVNASPTCSTRRTPFDQPTTSWRSSQYPCINAAVFVHEPNLSQVGPASWRIPSLERPADQIKGRSIVSKTRSGTDYLN